MPRDKREKMDQQTLEAICMQEIQSAIGNIGGLVSGQRDQALRYYLALPFGNEQPDRSQVVMSEVRDAIEGMLPGLLKIFYSADQMVKFEPQGPEDEKACKQATEYCNYIFMRDNPGFTLLYTWVKDALLEKVGIIKWWWDDKEDMTEESYNGMSDDRFVELVADDAIEVIEHTESETTAELLDPNTGAPITIPQKTHDVKVKRTKKRGRVRIANVPPEEFLISRDGTTIANARFVGHRVTKTVSELVAMGFSRDSIEDLPAEDQNMWSGEAVTRRAKDDETGSSIPQSLDTSMRRVTVIEGYYRVDADGDGIAELRQIWSSNQGKILDKEDGTPSDEVFNGQMAPMAAMCPCPLPHRFFGLSLADLTTDLQEIKSAVFRQLLDNMYLMNNARSELVMPTGEDVNIDDWLSNRPGGMVRTRGTGAGGRNIFPLETQPLGPFVLPTLDYLDTVKENRTGVTKYNQGLDPDSLNKTAHGINLITNFALDRQLLIAQIFAEGGMKDAFRGILQCASQNQMKARVIRLRNEWVPMDPREWAHLEDMTITVGIGNGNKTEMAQQVMALLSVQKEMAAGGLNQVVGPKEIYNAAAKFVEAIGLKTPDPYFRDPTAPPDEAHPAQQPPPPTPEMIAVLGQQNVDTGKVENDKQKIALDAADKQQQRALDGRKLDLDAQFKDRELAIREREALIKEHELGIKDFQARSGHAIETARLQDGQDARKQDHETARQGALNDAMTPAEGQPHPLETMTHILASHGQMMQQHGAALDKLASGIDRMAQPKSGRMIQRGPGNWEFQHAPTPQQPIN